MNRAQFLRSVFGATIGVAIGKKLDWIPVPVETPGIGMQSFTISIPTIPKVRGVVGFFNVHDIVVRRTDGLLFYVQPTLTGKEIVCIDNPDYKFEVEEVEDRELALPPEVHYERVCSAIPERDYEFPKEIIYDNSTESLPEERGEEIHPQ